jgi:hypothetical protein
MNKSKPKPKIISTEVQNEALMFFINKAIQKLKVEPLIDYNEEKLPDLFKSVFDDIMPSESREPGYDLRRDLDIEGLTNKAIEFVEEAKLKLFGITFLELLFLAVSASSEKYLKDNGESDKTIAKFFTLSEQTDWLEDIRRRILRSVIKLHGSGGDTASKYPWNYETCVAFVNNVDQLKPLWEFVLSFYKSKKASTDRFALLKREETFQNLSNGSSQELIEKVISNMLSQLVSKKSSRRRLSSPLALACNHAAHELNVHPKDKPYSPETLIRYYQEIKREEFERFTDPIIIEYFLTFSKPTQK